MGGNVSPFGSHGFNSDGNHPPFAHLNPTIGVFMAIPSILFVVDGFYSATVIQNDMKEPHKLGKALFVGLVIIIAIDIVVAISLMLGGGTIFHFSE
jgi:amino acid transporter